MTFNPDIHHRRSIRLRDYDYSQMGAYFMTICTQNRECLFGSISDGRIQSTDYGEIVNECWNDLPNHYGYVVLDTFALMPNHVHGIIIIAGGFVGAGFKPAPTMTKRHGLPEIIRAFKTFSARRINTIRNTPGTPVWQRNYYEHVIRNEDDLNKIREYIVHNPVQWADDEENPNALHPSR